MHFKGLYRCYLNNMTSVKFFRLVILCAVFTQTSVQAQLVSSNTNAWLHYMGTFMVTPKSSISLESSFRSAEMGKDFQQFFIRPSVDYKVKKNFTASLGYTYVTTGVYGEIPLNKTTMPENHVWVQGAFQGKIGKVSLNNRIRNENRFVGLASATENGFEVDDYTYRNRMRYMLLASLPIVKLNENQSINGFVGNEVFLNIGENAGATLFNQNRAIAGLGYRLNGSNQIQFAYILQNIWNHPNTIREDNSTFRMSYVSNIKLFRERKPKFTPNDRILSFN